MTPDFSILADSKDITAIIRDRLVELRVTDDAGQSSDAVTIVLDDRDNRIALPRKGATLEISLGFRERGLASMGRYTVDETSISGPPDILTIRGRAADLREGMKSPKSRSWDNVTLGTLVTTIATEHGYAPAIGAALGEIVLVHVDQTEESDLHLLTRLAAQYGAVSKPAGGKLLFLPVGEAKSLTGQSLPTMALPRRDFVRWDVTLADRGRYASVVASWHDGTETGQPQPVTVGSGDPAYTLRGTFADAAEATAAARAKLAALERGQGTISGECQGDERLAAEGEVLISEVRDGVNGRWSLTHVTHTFSKSGGYRCDFQGETPKGTTNAGIDAATGAALEGLAHLRQSVADILATPIGSRAMRRDYGSRLFELVDRPVNAGWIADAYAYTAEALDAWEPRFRLESVILSEINDEGRPVLDLAGSYLPDGQPITLEGIEL